jgi:uncharacterized membrane protein
VQKAFRWLLALLMIVAGLNHFRDPNIYMAMMPPWIPAPALMIAISGVAEVAGGAGLLAPWPKLRWWSAIGLIALLICVFPANIYMATHQIPLGGQQLSPVVLWGRLPLQGLFIAWAWWSRK